ncbi:DoxX family protein [Croceicoccus gelatinilyticus]|uniref:DoxX family protein n=1 Tax=Croceicoccus gelatinilyticus TaxID=2835536 RepID=UPI001BCF5C47|nr:DoxX family protein [Croceicoccus gelatinilyticus]MBS7670695.1 DoxX family protein [Croceicoccus gelatinilyticus]
MRMIASHWHDATRLLGSRWVEGVALLFARVALAGVFWRSGRSKVVEGTWLQVSDATRYLFEYEYSSVPLPPAFAAQMATLAEFFLPVLIVLGLATRLSALALLGMTLVIQIFVYPEAWWTVHVIWAALALVLVSRGAGLFSLDAPLALWSRP